MMKIAVCDDEIAATSEMEDILLDIAKQKGIHIDIDIFFDGNEYFVNSSEDGLGFTRSVASFCFLIISSFILTPKYLIC